MGCFLDSFTCELIEKIFEEDNTVVSNCRTCSTDFCNGSNIQTIEFALLLFTFILLIGA